MNSRQNSFKRTAAAADLSAIESLTFDSVSGTRIWQWLDKKFCKLNESIDERFTQFNILLSNGESRITENITGKVKELIKECENRLLNEIDKRFCEIREEISDVTERVTQLETVAGDIETVKMQLKELKLQSTNECLIDSKLANELKIIKCQLNKQENLAVSCDLRINGIPYFATENLHEHFGNICNAIQINTPSYKNIYRVNNNNKTNSRNAKDGTIVVKLFTPFDKNSILRAVALFKRSQKTQLRLCHIGFESNQHIYINENLTTTNFKILQASLNLKRKNLISSAYSLRGLIYIKCVSTDEPKLIEDITDLNQFFRADNDTDIIADNTKDN